MIYLWTWSVLFFFFSDVFQTVVWIHADLTSIFVFSLPFRWLVHGNAILVLLNFITHRFLILYQSSSTKRNEFFYSTAGKISRRVSTVHYSDPKELENLNSTNAKHAHGNSSGVTGTTSSRYFPMQSSGAASSKGSRQRSSLTEASEPSSISKRRHASKSKSNLSEASHGHSTGISSMSPDHSHEGKAKRRKHKE